MPKSPRFRNICFTLNNYTEEKCLKAFELPTTYFIVGMEEAPTTGTPHLQGYAEFSKKMSLSTIKKYLGKAHIERPFSTGKVCSDYCKKTGCYFEHGQLKAQGKASWEVIKEAMNHPKDHMHTYNQYRRAYHDVMMHENEKKNSLNQVMLSTSDELNTYEEVQHDFPEWKIIIIYNICDLEYYVSRQIPYDTVIYMPKDFVVPDKWILFSRGIPYLYNYGYETRKVVADRIIICGVRINTAPADYKQFKRHNIITYQKWKVQYELELLQEEQRQRQEEESYDEMEAYDLWIEEQQLQQDLRELEN